MIRVHAGAAACALGLLAVILVVASLASRVLQELADERPIRILSVDAEQSLPTLFSVVIMFMAVALLALIAALERQAGASDASRWAILALGFLFMTADEALSVHERLVRPMRQLLGDEPLGVLFYAWVIPGLAIVLLVALLFVRFLRRLRSRTAVLFMVAGGLFLAGAIGLELAGGWYVERHGRGIVQGIISTVEEALEMAGIIVFIYALLDHLAARYGEVRLRLSADGAPQPSDRSHA